MPSQDTIDGLWALGATLVFLTSLASFALVCVYVIKKWK